MYNTKIIKKENIEDNISLLPLEAFPALGFDDNEFFIIVNLDGTPLSLRNCTDSFYLKYITLIGGTRIRISDKIEALIHIVNGVLKSNLNIYPDKLNNSLVFRTKKDIKEEVEKEIRFILHLTAAIITIVYTSENWLSEAQKESLIIDTYIDKETAISNICSIIKDHPLLKYTEIVTTPL